MSAAAKALDCLESAGKAATARPWAVSHRHASCSVHDDEQCGLGLEIEGPPEATMRGQFALAADASLIVAAVNLSSPLAAVARAAMARPWWRPESPRDPQFYRCVACRSAVPSIAIIEDDGHYDGCPMAKLDAALDALEAAAAEGGGA